MRDTNQLVCEPIKQPGGSSTGAFRLRRSWPLVGPVFFFEMVRAGRKPRIFDTRFQYLLLLFLVLFVGYFGVLLNAPSISFEKGLFSPRLSPKFIADFLLLFFLLFIAVQYVTALILTPAYLTGAIAEERDRNTLDALLATDLHNREIVLGIVLPRLVSLSLLFLAGMPILSLLQFMGGIEPSLVLAGFAFLGLTILSTAAISVVVSLVLPRSQSALLKVYVLIVGYLAISGLARAIISPLTWGTFPSTPTWVSPVTLDDIVNWLNAGNFITCVVQVVRGLYSGRSFGSMLPPALAAYGWFHGWIAFFCLLWIGLRFRMLVLGSPSVDAVTRPYSGNGSVWLLGLNGRPAVFERAMFWKELWIRPSARRYWPRTLGWGFLIAVLAAPLLLFLYYFGGLTASGNNEHLTYLINLWVRYLTLFIGSAMLVTVAIRAASSVAGERDRGTLDGLLSSPLTTRAILWNKWLASVLSPWRGGALLGLVWLGGVLTGGLHWLAVPCLMAAWFVYADWVAVAGLWFSVVRKTKHRAIFTTILALPFVAVPLALVAALVGGLLFPADEWAAPPLLLSFLSFSETELASQFRGMSDRPLQAVARLVPLLAIPITLLLWTLAAWGIRVLIYSQFRKQFHRWNDWDISTPAPALHAASRENGPMDQPKVRPFVRIPWLRLGLTVILLAVPALLLMLVFEWRRAQSQIALEQAMAEADRLDSPWQLEDLAARAPEVPPERNSAIVLARAYSLLPDKYWNDHDFSDAEHFLYEPSLPHQLHPRVAAILTRVVVKSQGALDEARRVAELPDGQFPPPAPENIDWFQADQSFGMAELLRMAAILHAQENRADEAAALCRALFNRGRAFHSEAIGGAAYPRSQAAYMAVDTLERVLALTVPNEQSLKQLQPLLEDEAKRQVLLEYFRGLRATSDFILRAMTRPRSRRGPFFWNGPAPRTGPFTGPWREIDWKTLFEGDLTRERASAIRVLTALVEAAKRPESVQEAAFVQLRASDYGPKASFFAEFAAMTAQLRLQVARVRSAIVAIACERFRLVNGRWPNRLEELIPKYLTQIPPDPYDGKPLRFKRRPDSVVVYSVGADLIDNGGSLERGPVSAPGLDIGFQIWDPPYRRRPPPPPPPELMD
jgi:ABC-type transport system involved in multi-copper enzyme maturation permease subunit